MSGGVCKGCGTPIPPSRVGRPRIWCTERCRKRTLYSRQCLDCGATVNTDGRVRDAAVRCVRCAARHLGAERKVWTREVVIAAMQEWARIHGAPPKLEDWKRRAGSVPRQASEWPNHNAVFRECGSWKEAMAAAGFTPRKQGGRPKKEDA